MEITNATFQLSVADGSMETYEARPKEAGSYPAIVVLMEAFGLNGHIKDVTERVAREGYVAIAPDLYHREEERIVPYKDVPKAISIMNRLQDSKVMDDVGATISYLKSKSCVKPAAIGVTGFCMGGRFTYLAAAHHNKDVKAAVAWYGVGIPAGSPSPLDRSAEITCPIHLSFGAKDPLIPQEQVEKIKKVLTELKKNFTIKVYPDVSHGFHCNERESYNADAAKDAWEHFKSFFAQHLKQAE